MTSTTTQTGDLARNHQMPGNPDPPSIASIAFDGKLYIGKQGDTTDGDPTQDGDRGPILTSGYITGTITPDPTNVTFFITHNYKIKIESKRNGSSTNRWKGRIYNVSMVNGAYRYYFVVSQTMRRGGFAQTIDGCAQAVDDTAQVVESLETLSVTVTNPDGVTSIDYTPDNQVNVASFP